MISISKSVAVWVVLIVLSICSPAILSAPALEEVTEKPVDWPHEREFWSFQLPQRHPAPAVRNHRWPQQPIDWFVLNRLETHGFSPALQSSKRVLIRRVAFDLTGLPPSSAEIGEFLADQRSDAYERLVDRLLASKRFGERMASLWLPLARYAEDQAHQVGTDTKFFYPNAWRYRLWLIDAFNQDLPYDRFLQLQLAADCLEGTNSPNLVALGFLGLGPKYYNRDRLEVQADEWEDRVDTVSRTMLGLTVACARCHDHKFDPITTQDYYALAGVFASTRMVNLRPDGSTEKNEAQITNMSPATLHVVSDLAEPRDLNVLVRGNVNRQGPVVPRRFLRVLSTNDEARFDEGSGRGALARAIGSPQNPLTSRVMVNRVWGLFFGAPLVASPSNFGHSGQPPTDPALLDDLAARFMENGWSIKGLVREFVLSATYRQASSEGGIVGSQTAGGEGLLSSMPRRRLSIEQWRDAVLWASGELESVSGPSLELEDPANRRRTVYARISRLKLDDLLMQFDYPDANVHAEKRSITTTAPQKLFVLNSPFILHQAKVLADRVSAEAGESAERRIRRLYELLLDRHPEPDEVTLALAYLEQPSKGKASRWESYAQVLLASNEMLYVD